MFGPTGITHQALTRFTGPGGKHIASSQVRIDDAGHVQFARTVEFMGEFRNPTAGATMVIDLSNGQKQWVPVGTATSILMTGPTGPSNHTLRFYHYRGSALLNWPTGGTNGVYWSQASMMRGSVASGAVSIVSVYATGATGPDANQYYAMGAPDFRRT